METKSIWKVNTQEKVLPKLNQDISCDILIVGGGIAGLSCAYYLKDTNRKIVLIDKNTCGSGATGYNTGKLTWMQDLIYHKIEKNYDTKTALLYLESQKEAIKLINDIVKDNHIDCNLTKTKAYVFTDQEKNYEKFNKEIKFYQENNIKYKINNQLPITYPSKLVIETDDNSFVFNPYKYLIELKEKVKNNIKIYEKTRCVSIDTKDGYYLARTLDNYVIKSKIIIVTTHYPIFIVPYFIPFKTEVKKFFLVAGEVKSKKDVQILSNGNPSISMRYYSDKENNYFIYGRNSHSTTKKLDIRDDYRTITEEYKTFFKKEANFFFHTHDLMTYDDMPLIGEVKPNLYIATGFNKWGNTNGTISGKIISDLIIKKENKYCEIFSPKRGLSLDKIKNIPEDFTGIFIVEESYYETNGKKHASSHIFLFTEEKEGILLSSYEIPAGADKNTFTYDSMLPVEYSELKKSEKFTPALYQEKDGFWEGGSVSQFTPVVIFRLWEKFSDACLEVSESMEVNGKRTFGYDVPIIYKRV